MSPAKKFNPGSPPYNSKRTIINYLDSGKYHITNKAKKCAADDFCWGKTDIVKVLKKLSPTKHFHKKAIHWTNPEIVVDYYRARGLMGENVFTHFHIDPEDDLLIINSFKEI